MSKSLAKCSEVGKFSHTDKRSGDVLNENKTGYEAKPSSSEPKAKKKEEINKLTIDGKIDTVFTDMEELKRAVKKSGYKNPLVNFSGRINPKIWEEIKNTDLEGQ